MTTVASTPTPTTTSTLPPSPKRGRVFCKLNKPGFIPLYSTVHPINCPVISRFIALKTLPLFWLASREGTPFLAPPNYTTLLFSSARRRHLKKERCPLPFGRVCAPETREFARTGLRRSPRDDWSPVSFFFEKEEYGAFSLF